MYLPGPFEITSCVAGEDDGILKWIRPGSVAGSRAGTVSNLFKELGDRVANDRYAQPTFSVSLLNKDMQLAIEMAKSNSAPPLISRAVEFLNEVALSQGMGASDTAIMWKCFRRMWEKQEVQCRIRLWVGKGTFNFQGGMS
jgi:3-hydroxyisobutyrate dehydrogenase-like beta-hydroxyacid dehydrogenase